jgi:hypothetical protein
LFKLIPLYFAKETVWHLWTNINNWASWHDDLEYCRMEDSFKVGAFFMLKPKGINAVKIEITEIIQGQKFTDCTKFFGAKMYDTHELEETPEGLRLTSTSRVTGPLQWLWVKLVARHVAESHAQENQTLIELARKHHA